MGVEKREEGKKRKRMLSVMIDDDMWEVLEAKAGQRRVSVSDVVREALLPILQETGKG